jgi:membrane-associated phospholipid phosphatase
MFLTSAAAISAFDARVVLDLNQVGVQWPAFVKFAQWLVNAQIVKFGPFIAATTWLWFSESPGRERRRQCLIEGILLAFAALIAGRLLALALPFRDRPFLDPTLAFGGGNDHELRTWSSFPSDHAAMAFALTASLYRMAPWVGWAAALHSAVVICLPRAFLGLHYPTDLIGGAAVGVTVVAVGSSVPMLRRLAKTAAGLELRRPELFYTIGFLTLYEITTMFHELRMVAVVLFSHLRHAT